jgi:hypothetical protein
MWEAKFQKKQAKILLDVVIGHFEGFFNFRNYENERKQKDGKGRKCFVHS